ncbi:DNA recombination protein RmuC [Lysobacter claricitrinus]|uniref:DNA recombination protein RmuC n=1 Tax=Lysobacter claricitrinus TaxID=3367728 RepID=UPI0037DADE5E
MTSIVALVAALIALAAVVIGALTLRQRGGDPRIAAERDFLAAELADARERARADGEALGGLRATADAHARVLAEAERLRVALDETRARAEQAAIDAGTARSALDDRAASLERAQHEIAALRAERDRLSHQHAQAVENLRHAEHKADEMRAFVEQAQLRLSDTFAQMAGKVFAERGELFEKNVKTATGQSKADIETLLKPFAEQLHQFRQRVDTVYGEEAVERAKLAGAVEKLHSLNENMAAKADQLTRALRGNAKVRGDWGELMLENVLRSSGLEAGVHYERQQTGSDDEGRVLRPDIVVRLPDDRRIVIDSKVNLIAWQDAMNADAPDVQHDAMRRHAVALRQHVKDLADRDYPKAIGDSALDTTVLFVPIEGALSAALGADDALQSFAFERRVVFASPNTLMAVLRVVDRLWARDKLQKQAQKIGEAGGLLLDALGAFLAEFDGVGVKLEQATKTFRDARNRLSDSTQAVLPRARKLAELGARGKKTLHPELQADDDSLLLDAPDTTTRHET